MWQRFTENGRKVIFEAQKRAITFGTKQVGPEHLLIGITDVPACVGAAILERLGLRLETVREAVEARITREEIVDVENMALTSEAKKVIDMAYEEANQFQHNYVGAEHLLLGLLRKNEGIAPEVLAKLGVTLELVRNQVRAMQPAVANQSHTEAITPTKEELLNLDEAVKFLGTSKPTLYRLLGQDEIKGLKVGRQWRFRKADLIAYTERSPVAFAAAPMQDLDRELAFFAEQLSEEATNAITDPEAKTIQLAHQIIKLAISSKASDIHLEPNANDFLLRIRVDGVLHEIRRLPVSMRESLTARFKIMAEMEISERRLPQDGRIPVLHEGKEFDLRVSLVPSLFGEAITMRILDRNVLIGLDKLGLTPEDGRKMRDFMHQPNGILIATGPTSSGKTTLLYSCLKEVADIERKTMTIEDPVEYALPYTTQTQVNKRAGLNFASVLRSFLRQDPDIIMVGEIRDLETAQIGVEVALTGHLLLTSMHTEDAPSALLRLLDIGIEPYLVSATIVGVVAMRLMRQLCDACKQPVDLSTLPMLNYMTQLASEGGYSVPDDAVFMHGVGCEQCRQRGYRGRTGLYEILTMTEPLTEAVLRRASVEELTSIAVMGGMRTLLADGIRKAVEGKTTIEEVMRVVSVSL